VSPLVLLDLRLRALSAAGSGSKVITSVGKVGPGLRYWTSRTSHDAMDATGYCETSSQSSYDVKLGACATRGNMGCDIPSACIRTTRLCLLQYCPNCLCLALKREISCPCAQSTIYSKMRSAEGQALADFAAPVRHSEAGSISLVAGYKPEQLSD
jgi:hypothetical protein